MKKIYKTPEVRLVVLGEEIMDGLTQKSVSADGQLPGPGTGTGIGDGGESSGTDDPGAKSTGRFWDDEY